MGILEKFRIHKKQQTFPDCKDDQGHGDDREGVTPTVEEVVTQEDDSSVDYTDGGATGEEEFVVSHGHHSSHGDNNEEEEDEDELDSLDESLDTRSIISDSVSDVVEGVDLNALAGLELEDACAKTPSEISRRTLVKRYNDIAVQFMEGKDFDHSLAMLEKAESLLDTLDGLKETSDDTKDGNATVLTRSRLRSMTYNNFGCLYRRISLPEKALEYLEKALEIEELSNNVNECAATHLNLSASHSVLHNDMLALRHGEKAIILIQGQLWPGSTFQEGLATLVAMLLDKTDRASWRAQVMKDAHVLAMAYHNVGTQNERLGRMKEAQVSFSRACSIGMKVLGPRSVTTAALIRGNKLFQERLRDKHNPGHALSKHTAPSITRSKSLSNLKGRQSEVPRGSMGMKSTKSTASLVGKTGGKKTKLSKGTLPFNR